MQIAELKASGELLANLTVVDNEPVRLSGVDGFRVRVQYNSKRGLPFDLVVWGVADQSGYSMIKYTAPACTASTTTCRTSRAWSPPSVSPRRVEAGAMR